MNNNKALALNQPDGYLAEFSVILPIVNCCNDHPFKDQRGIQKIYATLSDKCATLRAVILNFH
jgi:hypothetical protein